MKDNRTLEKKLTHAGKPYVDAKSEFKKWQGLLRCWAPHVESEIPYNEQIDIIWNGEELLLWDHKVTKALNLEADCCDILVVKAARKLPNLIEKVVEELEKLLPEYE